MEDSEDSHMIPYVDPVMLHVFRRRTEFLTDPDAPRARWLLLGLFRVTPTSLIVVFVLSRHLDSKATRMYTLTG